MSKKQKMTKELKKLVALVSVAVIRVVGLSIGVGLGFNEANAAWHLKANAKEIELEDFKSTDELLIMSYNIRVKSADLFGNKRWGIRLPYMLEIIEKNKPDVMGMQEIQAPQERHLEKYLVGYKAVVAYRDRGLNKEGIGIYYREDRFEEVKGQSGGFWLSQTPDKQSKGWDASVERICTYVTLREKQTGFTFTVFNTHLDHRGPNSRVESIKLVTEKIKDFNAENAILMGDFNFDETGEEYLFAEKHFINAKYGDVSSIGNYDEPLVERINEGSTYNGWSNKVKKEETETAIDHIFYTGNLTPQKYGIIQETPNGVYPSDHFPVVSTFKK